MSAGIEDGLKVSELSNTSSVERGGRTDHSPYLEFVFGMCSEYAVCILRKDPSDPLYIHIMDFFRKRVIPYMEMVTYFLDDPEMEVFRNLLDVDGLPAYCTNDLAEGIIWKSDEESNTYSFGDITFTTRRLFLTQVRFMDESFCLSYSERNGSPAFSARRLRNIPEIPATPPDARSIKTMSLNGRLTEDQFFNLTTDLSTADPDQRKAICAGTDRNLLVIAGAGSGKTRTIVGRMTYLNLVAGIPLERMVMLTFTRAATSNMRNVVTTQLEAASSAYGTDISGARTETFDSFFKHIIEKHWEIIGFARRPSFNYQSTPSERVDLMRAVMDRDQFFQVFNDRNPNELYKEMERYAQSGSSSIPGINVLLETFVNHQLESCIIHDFFVTAYILKRELEDTEGKLYKKMCETFDCILIDEFQDINGLQNAVFSTLYGSDIHFSFVGDDDQTVYTWRGSDNTYIRSQKDDSGTDTICLTTNYRNNPHIVAVGNSILEKLENRAKSDTPINAYKKTGSKVRICHAHEDYSDLVLELNKLHDAGMPWGDICILSRAGKYLETVALALAQADIPGIRRNSESTPDTGRGFEIFTALCQMYATNGKSWEPFKTLLMYAGLDTSDPRFVRRLILERRQEDVRSIQKYCRPSAVLPNILRMDISEILTLAEAMDPLSHRFRSFKDAAIRFDNAYSSRFPGESYSELERTTTMEAFTEFVSDVPLDYPGTELELIELFSRFRIHISKSEITWGSGNNDSDKVTLATIHGSKGLQYRTVFVVELNDGSFPNTMIDKEYTEALMSFGDRKGKGKSMDDIRNTVDVKTLDNLLTDCSPGDLDSETEEGLAHMGESIESAYDDILDMTADAVKDYISDFETYVLPHMNRRIFAIKNVSDSISRRQKDADAVRDKLMMTEDDDSATALTQELASIAEEIESLKNRLEETRKNRDALKERIAHLHRFNRICLDASYYMEYVREFNEDKEYLANLDRKRMELNREELRVFYVAVSRAIDSLYLCYNETRKPSRFLNYLPNKDTESYILGSRSRDISGLLDEPLDELRILMKSGSADPDDIDDAMEQVIKGARKFYTELESHRASFLKSNPAFGQVSENASSYRDRAVKLIGLTEVAGISLRNEIIYNISRMIHEHLADVCGDDARPFSGTDMDYSGFIRSVLEPPSFVTRKPGTAFIDDLVSSQPKDFRDDFRMLALEYYLVLSGRFKVGKTVKESWEHVTIGDNPDAFLCAALDLANLGYQVSHGSTPPEDDPLPHVFTCAETVINCTR